jgi:integrase
MPTDVQTSSKPSKSTVDEENRKNSTVSLPSGSSKGRLTSARGRPNQRPPVNLTKRYIDALSDVSKPVLHWDKALTGFGLHQFKSGVLTFVLDYRNAEGRKLRVTIGRFGALTVEQARDQARALRGRVAQGGDPAREVKQRREAPTVGDLLDAYVTKHLEVGNAPRTQRDNKALIKRHIRPALGALKVASVTRQDVLKLRRRLEKTPRQANLALAVLSKAFNLAEEWEWRTDGSNPCRRVPRFEENARERFLSAEELARLGAALEEAETKGLPWRERKDAQAKHRAKPENRRTIPNRAALTIVKLLLFTGARASEILGLAWADVDIDRGTVSLPSRKGGARRPHPVSAYALDLLSEQTRTEGSPWVFPAPMDASRPLSLSVLENAWQALRAHAGLDDVHLHDLRHTAGTYVSQTGANAFSVRDFLRHKTLAMTGRYANRDADPIRQAAKAIGERLHRGLTTKLTGHEGTRRRAETRSG